MATAEYYQSLPAKRMGSGALFFNSEGKVLIVKPTYKDTWEIPGGVVEKNESPRNAALREVKEELGLNKNLGHILCVDYQDPYGIKSESLMFIFDGQVLTNEEIQLIILETKELSEYRFVTVAEASTLLSPILARRVEQAIKARASNKSVYLENRELV